MSQQMIDSFNMNRLGFSLYLNYENNGTRVLNGMVVIEGNHLLPEGARVIVLVQNETRDEEAAEQSPVSFPIVHSKNPGTLDLFWQPHLRDS